MYIIMYSFIYESYTEIYVGKETLHNVVSFNIF